MFVLLQIILINWEYNSVCIPYVDRITEDVSFSSQIVISPHHLFQEHMVSVFRGYVPLLEKSPFCFSERMC